MTTRLHGILADGLNKPIINATVALLAKGNTITVLNGSEAIFRTDGSGAYDVTVQTGHYKVIIGPQGIEPYKAGEIVIYGDSPEGSLNGYLINWAPEELTPDVIKQVQELVSSSETYALQAASSAASAASDASDAKASKTAAETSEANALTYKNQAKTYANTANQAQSSAAGSANTATQAVSETTALKDAAAASATKAANSATEAGEQAGNAGTSATAAKNDADRAKTEADRAESAANSAPEIQPLPDVWIPFNDSLDMITGFSPSYKKIIIGDDEITMAGDKIVKFNRASTATYVNKSGVLTVAAIDEPRFEKEGLLIEGLRSNNFINSNSPSNWNRNVSRLDVSADSTDEFGITSAKFTYKESETTGPVTIISTGTSRTIPIASGEYGTISIRARIGDKYSSPVRLKLRFSKLNEDGAGNTLITDISLDLVTLKITGGTNLTYEVKQEQGGWVLFQATYKATEDINLYARMEMLARSGEELVAGQFITLATAQCENGSAASSFIITEGSPATRASDLVTLPVKNNIYNLPITILCEVNRSWVWNTPPNAAPTIMDFTGQEAGQAIIHGLRGGTDVDTGSPYIDIGDGSSQVNEYVKTTERKFIAGFRCKSDGGTQAICQGITSSSAKTTYSHVVSTATIRIGGQTNTGERHLFGHIRNFRIWHKELTDRQLKESV